jgi:hypothetical protein
MHIHHHENQGSFFCSSVSPHQKATTESFISLHKPFGSLNTHIGNTGIDEGDDDDGEADPS